jgi:catechol 2,3-dioxygenase
VAFSVEHIDHVEVYVRDIEAAVRWYERALGLRVVHRYDPQPVMIGAGGTSLALFRAARAGPDSSDDDRQPAIRWRRVAWKTTPQGLAAAQEHLATCGIAFEGPVDHGVSKSLYFADPDGNPLEITCDA